MKRSIYLVFLFIIFASCKSTKTITDTTSEKETDKANSLVKQIICSACENIGISYKMAGTTKSGYDCSGLVYSIFNLYGIKLPRSSFEQSKMGIVLGRNIEKAKKGDLIFFKTNGGSKINHVGIVIEVTGNEIRFIHSSTSKGVIISSTKEPYYQNTFFQLNRIL